MYLHVGNNKIIKNSDIIGIFDIDNATISSVTRKYLSNKEKSHKVINICNEIPRSFILVQENDDALVYISQISSQALHGRIK